MELTREEHDDIALYRTYDESGLTKAVCHRLRALKIKALDMEAKARKDRRELAVLKAEKAGCFCSKADRRVFREAFYAWYDDHIKKNPPAEPVEQ